jgi:hypothetical protein
VKREHFTGKLCTLDFHFKEVNSRFQKLGL